MTIRTTLDRGTGIAIWRQIMEWLKAEIASGAFEKGSRLPPESEIAARFGVNRHTVRRAIAALTAEGVLRADQGRGTFVAAAPITYPITSRTRFSEIVSGQDKAPSGRLIGSGTEEADALLANWLKVPIGTLLIRIENLRVADGVPVMIGTSWFEQSRFPNLVADYAETGSITKALAKAGVSDYRRKESRVTGGIGRAARRRGPGHRLRPADPGRGKPEPRRGWRAHAVHEDAHGSGPDPACRGKLKSGQSQNFGTFFVSCQ